MHAAVEAIFFFLAHVFMVTVTSGVLYIITFIFIWCYYPPPSDHSIRRQSSGGLILFCQTDTTGRGSVGNDWYPQRLNLLPEPVSRHRLEGIPRSAFFTTQAEERGPFIWSWRWSSPNEFTASLETLWPLTVSYKTLPCPMQ